MLSHAQLVLGLFWSYENGWHIVSSSGALCWRVARPSSFIISGQVVPIRLNMTGQLISYYGPAAET